MSQEPEQPPAPQEPEQPPAPQDKYSDASKRKGVSPSLQRASYDGNDMIWPTPPDLYRDNAPTLPRQRRELTVHLNGTTFIALGVAALLVVALVAVLLMRNTTTVTQSNSGDRKVAGGQSSATVTATFTPTAIATATAVATSTPGNLPVGAPTQKSAPPTATPAAPTATPTPPTCNTIDPAGASVTLYGDDGVSGGSGSGKTIGSLGTFLEIERAVNGNECIVTRIQQIVVVNLNNVPETAGSRCTSSPYPCDAQGTLVQTNQSTHQIVSTSTDQYPFGGQVSKNIYGGLDSAPPGGNQCVTGTSDFIDNFAYTHQGGNVVYCWQS